MALGRITKRVEVEMTGSTKRFAMYAKQGDKAPRFIEAVLFNCGEPYVIPEGSKATAYIKKPDRYRVYTPCTFDDNVVTVELSNNALAAAGTALCEVEIQSNDGSQLVTSVTFEIEIEESVRSDSAIMSSNEFTLFEKTMQEYAEAEAVRDAGEQKRAEAEVARDQAEKARTQTEAARTKAEETRAAAETKRTQNEQSRAEAEAARVQAEKARTQTEAARTKAEEARAAAETKRSQDEQKRAEAEAARVQEEKNRAQRAQETLDKANDAVKIAEQVNEAKYVEDKDNSVKYAYALYAKGGIPHLKLTRIEEG